MRKPSAILDKSLFHQLCVHSDAEDQKRLWDALHERYQLVVPLILIEESVVNAVAPGNRPAEQVNRLIDQVAMHHTCWLDDLYEIVFRELVRKEPVSTLPPLSEPAKAEIFGLRFEDEGLQKWAEQRKQEARFTHNQWKNEQKRLALTAERAALADEAKLFDVVRSEFLRALLDATRRQDMLESIIGTCLRNRYPTESKSIDRAFAAYTPETFTQYYATLALLQVRLAYLFAPVFTLPGPSPHMPCRYLKQEPNNLFDSEYVTLALLCDRFLTRDEGQARMCRSFELGGFWKGKVIYIPADQDMSKAIPDALI